MKLHHNATSLVLSNVPILEKSKQSIVNTALSSLVVLKKEVEGCLKQDLDKDFLTI